MGMGTSVISRRERFEHMYELYMGGSSYSEIGKVFKISRERVRQIFRDWSTPEEYTCIKKQVSRRFVTDEKVDRISSLIQKGHSCSEVADELGYSIDLVKRVSSKYRLQRLKSVS